MALHKTLNTSSLLMMFILSMLLLVNIVKSETFSFSYSKFKPNDGFDLVYLGDARPEGGVIMLTERDGVVVRKNSVGRVVYVSPIHLWDKTTKKIADFATEFTFVVDSTSLIHGDGLAFFMIPFDADPRIPKNSTGGYLGLFSPENAFRPQENQIVAVEFDSFGNVWDPITRPIAPHVGIDINSLDSVKTADWAINSVGNGSLGRARISYDSKAKKLFVLVHYGKSTPDTFISLTVDLSTVLPEWVRIGFSAATGNSVETHDIVSWSFVSSI